MEAKILVFGVTFTLVVTSHGLQKVWSGDFLSDDDDDDVDGDNKDVDDVDDDNQDYDDDEDAKEIAKAITIKSTTTKTTTGEEILLENNNLGSAFI